MRELIAKAGEPEPLSLGPEPDRLVFEDRDAHVGERAAHGGKVVPPIVVAENRPSSERRLKPRQLGRPGGVGHALGREPVPRSEVSEQNDQIGFQSVGRIDDPANVRQRHTGPPAWRSAMTVIESLRPAGQDAGDGL